ncbi:CCHC-type domain-containing protein [Abeliophyllum distichum]|uniref:CCHC-type domain-containing protein n=1 Tax=Abeliophyllum distichum TaxID=126358 RepID=A0ABD1P046_9LAMI
MPPKRNPISAPNSNTNLGSSNANASSSGGEINVANFARELLAVMQELGQQQQQAPPFTEQQTSNQQVPTNEQALNQRAFQPQIVPNPRDRTTMIEQFHKMNPPSFEGSTDPLAVEDWLRELECIFKFIRCEDVEKVTFSVFMLKKGASHWWDMTTRSLTHAEEQAITWVRFKELVEEKFFPVAVKDQKEMEFLRLQHGTMTLVEYERKFEELSRFAPHLVDTEEKRARRFERGLQPYVRDIVSALELGTYREVLKRAQTISYQRTQNVGNFQQVQNFSGKRKWNFDRQNNGKRKGNNAPKKGKTETSGAGDNKRCPKCDRPHKGECLLGKKCLFQVWKIRTFC